jgi:hypothetical protein
MDDKGVHDETRPTMIGRMLYELMPAWATQQPRRIVTTKVTLGTIITRHVNIHVPDVEARDVCSI